MLHEEQEPVRPVTPDREGAVHDCLELHGEAGHVTEVVDFAGEHVVELTAVDGFRGGRCDCQERG